jgi:hypothetical protein
VLWILVDLSFVYLYLYLYLFVRRLFDDDCYRHEDLDHEQLYLFVKQTQNDEQQRGNEFQDAYVHLNALVASGTVKVYLEWWRITFKIYLAPPIDFTVTILPNSLTSVIGVQTRTGRGTRSKDQARAERAADEKHVVKDRKWKLELRK